MKLTDKVIEKNNYFGKIYYKVKRKLKDWYEKKELNKKDIEIYNALDKYKTNILPLKLKDRKDLLEKLKPKEKAIVQNYDFFKKNILQIKYMNIDFLIFKFTPKQNMENLHNDLIVPTYDDIREEKFFTYINKYVYIYNEKNENVKFFFTYMWKRASDKKLLFDIFDQDKNKIGQFIILVEENKNNYHSLELSSLFFKTYYDKLDIIMNYFNLSKTENNVKRIDYCVDFAWLETFEYIPFIKDKDILLKTHAGLTATDIKNLWIEYSDLPKEKLKKLLSNAKKIQYWKQETWLNFKTSLNDLKFYDKVLDALDNDKKLTVLWRNPYKEYLHSPQPINRIELKKKSLRKFPDSSFLFWEKNIEWMFWDYLNSYMKIDLSCLKKDAPTLNWKKLYKASEKYKASLEHSEKMALAYLKNIARHRWRGETLQEEQENWENELFKFLYNNFPNLENKRPLDLMDTLEISDIFHYEN